MKPQMLMQEKFPNSLEIWFLLSSAGEISTKISIRRYSHLFFDIPVPYTQYLAELLLDWLQIAGH